MADMLLELAVWSAGCLFLVMSESTEDLIVNSVSMHMPILGWTTGVSLTPSGCVGEAGLYSHMHMRCFAQVAVNFIGEVDLLLLSCFFSTASRQRLAKYRTDHRWGVAEGVTQKDKMTPGVLR